MRWAAELPFLTACLLTFPATAVMCWGQVRGDADLATRQSASHMLARSGLLLPACKHLGISPFIPPSIQNRYGQCGTGTASLEPLTAPAPIAADADFITFDQVPNRARVQRGSPVPLALCITLHGPTTACHVPA